ncbi:MAG: ArnT family glycosyltransferase [Candidatus Binataceae bacterium]
MNDRLPVVAVPPECIEGEVPRERPENPADTGAAAAPASRWFDLLAAPRLAVPFLVAFGLIVLVVNLGGYPAYTRGEPREAIRIVDIMHGSWILPTQPGIGLPWKPPLMYWLGGLVSMLLGAVNEWSVRLPSGLLAVGGIVCCYLYVRRLFDDRSALAGALILATTLQYQQAGSAARVDMTLTFFIELACFEFIAIAEGLTQRRMLLYAALAAAVLAKGPIGVVLPTLVALIWMATERRWSVLRELRLVSGASLVAVVAGGWYAAAAIVGGQAFVRRQILAENLYRLLPNHAFHEPHQHPFYFVELALIAGFMPWTVFIPLAAAALCKRMRIWNPRFSYLVIWTATVLIFYNLPRSKRGVYLLALYPALAAIVAILLNAARHRTAELARPLRLTARAGSVAFTGVGLAALVCEFGMWLYGPGFLDPAMRLAGVRVPELTVQLAHAIAARPVAAVVLPVLVCASGAYLMFARFDIDRVFAAVVSGISCAILAAHLFVVPAIAQTLTLKYFTLESMKIAGSDRLANLEAVNFDVAFYSERSIPLLSPLNAHEADYLFCSRRFYWLLSEKTRGQFTIVLTSGPTSLDASGRMLLLKRAGENAVE